MCGKSVRTCITQIDDTHLVPSLKSLYLFCENELLILPEVHHVLVAEKNVHPHCKSSRLSNSNRGPLGEGV